MRLQTRQRFETKDSDSRNTTCFQILQFTLVHNNLMNPETCAGSCLKVLLLDKDDLDLPSQDGNCAKEDLLLQLVLLGSKKRSYKITGQYGYLCLVKQILLTLQSLHWSLNPVLSWYLSSLDESKHTTKFKNEPLLKRPKCFIYLYIQFKIFENCELQSCEWMF